MRRDEYDALQPKLSRFVRGSFRRLGTQDVEDLCQQAWLTLHRHRDVEGKHVPNSFPFLCQAARWGAFELMKGRRRCQPVPDIPESAGPIEATPEVAVDRIFSERHMEDMLERVPPRERELLRLVIAGEPRADIEERLGISGVDLLALWDRTCSQIISRALSEPGNLLRQAILDANLEDRLKPETRTILDRAAANNPDLCLEMASSL